MLDTKKLNALISSIGKNSAKQREDIQTALVSCAVLAFRDRNVDPAIRLFAAVGSGVYKAGMSKWLSLNGPVYFKNDAPHLSDARQKEMIGSCTVEEFEAEVLAMPTWYAIDEANNTAPNVWDSGEFVKKIDDYMINAIKKAGKNDLALKEALDTAHNLMRAEIAKLDIVTIEE